MRVCVALIVISYLIVGGRVEAFGQRCNGVNVAVQASADDDARSVCAAAAAVVRFLSAQGLKTDAGVEVAVVDKLPAPISASAFGGYLRLERRAYLLSAAKVAARGTVFGLPFDGALYRALAAHEIAHAIAADNFRIAEPSLEAEECIAYIAMFATLPDAHRARLLARYAGQSFAGDIQINALAYFLDPFRFGILAYKYFMQTGQGAGFLQQILAGRVLHDAY